MRIKLIGINRKVEDTLFRPVSLDFNELNYFQHHEHERYIMLSI